MSSQPSNEIARTPARGSTTANPFSTVTPPQSPTVKTTTRADTIKARYRYVPREGNTPSGTDWESYIVKLGAEVTGLEGPVYGIIGERSTTRAKGKKKQSQQPAYLIREVFDDTIGDESFVVQKDNIEFVTKESHKMHLDNLLYRHGRMINYVGVITYCQVIEVSKDLMGCPDGLLVLKRGDEPGDENYLNLDSIELKVCSLIEYMTNYGGGQPKTRQKKVNQTGALLVENLLTSTDLKGYQGKSKVFCTIDCDMGQELTFLTEVGEWKQTTPEEYLETEVFGLEEPQVEEKPKIIKKKATLKVKIPSVKTQKTLFPETEVNSESGEEEEAEDQDTTLDPIDSFTVTSTLKSGQGKVATTTNKFAMQVTGIRRERHEALFNQELLGGKWKSTSIENRADKLFRAESKRGKYVNTRTSFQIWFFGNFGEDPISYFSPYEKVPTSEMQAIPNEKWTTSVPPTKWVTSMKQLSECLAVLSGIAHEYFRYDVFVAIEAVAKKSHLMYDMDLAMAGVNAYRDLYAGALSAIVDGAVDGYKGEHLLQVALAEMHPASKAYADIICDRLQRVNAGSQ